MVSGQWSVNVVLPITGHWPLITEVMRAFIAIPLPSEVQEALSALQRDVAKARADVKWVRQDQLHVTLKFLGEISEAQREVMTAMLRRVADATSPLALGVAELGAFPSVTAPRVIWVGLRGEVEAVRRMAATIEQEGGRLGLPKDDRPFAAHVTLGRVRSSRGREALAQQLRATVWVPPPPWQVSHMRLYQSVLSPSGPSYTVLAEIPLSVKTT